MKNCLGNMFFALSVKLKKPQVLKHNFKVMYGNKETHTVWKGKSSKFTAGEI